MNIKPVKCVETGQVFESIQKAAEWLGLYQSSVSSVLRGKVKTAGGYHWEYALPEDRGVIAEPIVTEARQASGPKSRPSMTIDDVQAEAQRQTRQTGRLVQYSDLQKQETLRLANSQVTIHKPKRRASG
jgi:hypothetical protein